jgi:hypothetical protein
MKHCKDARDKRSCKENVFSHKSTETNAQSESKFLLYRSHELYTEQRRPNKKCNSWHVPFRTCPVLVSIRQHTSAYVSIRQPSAYVSIRQHTSAYVSIRQHTSAYVSIRQHTSAYVSIRQHTSAYVSIRQHTSAYVSIRQHTLGRVTSSSGGVTSMISRQFPLELLESSCCMLCCSCCEAAVAKQLLHARLQLTTASSRAS